MWRRRFEPGCGSRLNACQRVIALTLSNDFFARTPDAQSASRFLPPALCTLWLTLLSGYCRRLGALVVFLACSASVLPTCALANFQGATTPSQLAVQAQNISKLAYAHIVENSTSDMEYKSLKALKRAVSSSPSSIESNSLIVKNLPLLHYHIDDVDVFFFLKYLLDNNLYWAAKDVLQAIKNENDQGLTAQGNYYAGEYFFSRGEWNKAYQYLAIGNHLRSELHAEHANLMMGVTQQSLKNHRQAINFYKSLKPESKFYDYAQLNIAIVSIRQGWWADSYRIITGLLENLDHYKNREFVNRIYLVLGYGMLEREYYRDAKQAFLNIEKNSRFFQRALLGLGLSAMGAEEFAYAANILSLLKTQSDKTLEVDEAPLLYAYSVEQSGDEQAALKEYRKALLYYQSRSQTMTDLSESSAEFYSPFLLAISEKKYSLAVSDVLFNIRMHSDSFAVKDYQFLLELQRHLNTGGMAKYPGAPIDLLIKQYQKLFFEQAEELLLVRSAAMASYKSQNRYAMARLLDRSLIK